MFLVSLHVSVCVHVSYIDTACGIVSLDKSTCAANSVRISPTPVIPVRNEICTRNQETSSLCTAMQNANGPLRKDCFPFFWLWTVSVSLEVPAGGCFCSKNGTNDRLQRAKESGKMSCWTRQRSFHTVWCSRFTKNWKRSHVLTWNIVFESSLKKTIRYHNVAIHLFKQARHFAYVQMIVEHRVRRHWGIFMSLKTLRKSILLQVKPTTRSCPSHKLLLPLT